MNMGAPMTGRRKRSSNSVGTGMHLTRKPRAPRRNADYTASHALQAGLRPARHGSSRRRFAAAMLAGFSPRSRPRRSRPQRRAIFADIRMPRRKRIAALSQPARRPTFASGTRYSDADEGAGGGGPAPQSSQPPHAPLTLIDAALRKRAARARRCRWAGKRRSRRTRTPSHGPATSAVPARTAVDHAGEQHDSPPTHHRQGGAYGGSSIQLVNASATR